MKKTLAFLLTVLILISSLTAFMAKELIFQSENVVFTPTEEIGDRQMLRGMSADITFTHTEKLNWNVHFEPLGKTVSDLSFKKMNTYDGARSYFGLTELYTDIFEMAKDNEELKSYIGDGKEQLKNTGEQKTFTVKMSDYYDYYPIKADVHLPGVSISYSSYFDEKGEYDFTGISKERGLGFINRLQDYLKIPVYEDDVRIETVERINHGYSYTSDEKNTYSFSFNSAVFPDKLYFTINNRTVSYNAESSKILDTSEIPGGYGIYSVPYGDEDIKYEEMKTEYFIDENSTVIYLDCDTERDVLYLALRENDSFVFKIIDRKTMTDISSLELYSFGEGDFVPYYEYDDFIVFAKNDFEIKIVKRNADGTYSEAFSYTFPKENEINWEYFPYENACAFDGERLIILTKEREMYHEQPDFSLTAEIIVLTEKGIAYYGKWENSLGEAVNYRGDSFCDFKNFKITIKS